ncbi:myrosinase-binding protein-like protein [Venturia nashicola]|uniref:Myrosinase-binding protein-like protein n=1 Tax=Venturia nashicola TaxID=86259 RepID=A0A4Z1PE88_9PEZI|nr:myrosinase-binding protein-like protein [Venturia nashicola]TLD39589.1 myrosinase-binding protein-like protein [Venturia nashicola]
MPKLSIQWQEIASSDEIRRSSQTIAVQNDGTLTIFGGEIVPREPVDNKVYSLSLTQSNATISTQDAQSLAPSPRIGSPSTTLNAKTYLFSGRGGVDMAPVSENGNLWCYHHTTKTWSSISPADSSSPYPEARSYHSMTTDGRDAIYLHAGCPEKGRLNDLWAFQISTKKWIRLAPAPGKGMGGTSITFCSSSDSLYRMNGFDGISECGGQINVYHPEMDSWSTKSFKADGINGPEARSVSALLSFQVDGKCYIITAFGEHDPSSLGHAGAGKMLRDVWAWDTKEDIWYEVSQEGASPVPRGWFAAQRYGDDSIVVHGGLAEDNSRLGDVWIGKLIVES